MLRHNLLRIIDLICQAKYRSGQFEEIPHYKLTFSPLWSLSETERAQVDQVKAATAQTKAATAQLYIDMGALDPSEVRSGLKSSEDYVIEDLVDENSPDITDAEMQTLMQGVMGAEQQEAASPSLPQANVDGTPKGAVGILVIRGGEILCGERRNGQGICGPGGHIEEGETPREAAARETWEEFGITPTELICVGQLTELPPQYGKPYIFLSTAYTGEITPNTPEMQHSAFAKLPSLHSANLFLPFRESLDFLLAQLDGDKSIGEFSENSIDKQSFSDIIKPRNKSSNLPENALPCRENSAIIQTTETDEFKESDHPRDKNGQFTASGGETGNPPDGQKWLSVGSKQDLDAAIKSGRIKMQQKTSALSKHRKGSKEYNVAIAQGKKVSTLSITDNEIQKLVTSKSGTGTVYIDRETGQLKETIDCGKTVGEYISASGKMSQTTRLTVHHSRAGYHVVPASSGGKSNGN